MTERFSQALKEAYASAPAAEIILDTLELRHPAFVDENGANIALRVVRNTVDFTGRLEASAPMNAGEDVVFQALGFDISMPEISPQGAPEVTITLDNVTREMIPHFRAAAMSNAPVELTYRPYLASDPTTPQTPTPLTLTVKSCSASVGTATIKAEASDIANKAFPSNVYSAQKFPGLVL